MPKLMSLFHLLSVEGFLLCTPNVKFSSSWRMLFVCFISGTKWSNVLGLCLYFQILVEQAGEIFFRSQLVWYESLMDRVVCPLSISFLYFGLCRWKLLGKLTEGELLL